ncbi:MAG: bifunctional UDP-N-acetylglucosamine diphosphorylase/glucosamine-1-phosphate N-acetyltransferase GlmU [Pseudomonadota bacterium]
MVSFMDDIYCIVLAAGLGKRLGGDTPKALAKTRDGALIDLVLNGLSALRPRKTVVVVGHKREMLERHLLGDARFAGLNIEFAHQAEQLGTGHAARCALPHLEGLAGTIVITYADHPLFTQQTLKHFVDFHSFKKATLSTISFISPPPSGYGRVIRSGAGDVLSITEAKDCTPEQLLISEVNSGVYAVDSSFLRPALQGLENNNAQGEFYLTDIVEKAANEGQRVSAFPLGDPNEAAGVNTLADLRFVNSVLAARQIAQLEDSGVIFDDPQTCYIEPGVSIEAGARIGPNVQLRGATRIEAQAVCEGGSLLIDSTIKSRVQIKLGSRVEGATIGEDSSVGPFANIRPGTVLGSGCRIGNFVETKSATLADGAKASHLTYLGDCVVGKDTNIGAGTITCNYDGYKKSTTTIGSDVFVGSNSCLVAPVKIEDGALIAAGSVITSDVPKDALALGRATQSIKQGWAKRRREALSGDK